MIKIKLLLIIIYITYNYNYITKGIYIINNLENNYYFSFKNNNIFLSIKQTNFRIVPKKNNIYYIESKGKKKKICSDIKGKIFFFNKHNINFLKCEWIISKKNEENEYLIQNNFNKKYLEGHNFRLYCKNSINSNEKTKTIQKNFIFKFRKLYEENIFNNTYLKIIQNEPIDIVIKYIDLTDKNLNRSRIKQIYKDKDNEELKYSIRSIFEYIPWIRKIYILMPNEVVKFLKSCEFIGDKIIFIKDKDFLGFDSANIQSFLFNLYKMEKFGLSKNFIYMEDDYFIGKPLKKIDFIYYDEKKKKIIPYLISNRFYKINNSELIEKYNNLFKEKDLIHPHSSLGFWMGFFSTEKFFIENYNLSITSTEFTHNAICENIDDLKIIYQEAKKYKYINQTLYSNLRYILTLNHQHLVNLFNLNINHNKVRSIKSKYISMEKINKYNLNYPLFVINTGGNHIPLNRQYKIEKKIMQKKFPHPIIYEISEKIYKKIIVNKMKLNCLMFKILIALYLLKIFIYKNKDSYFEKYY